MVTMEHNVHLHQQPSPSFQKNFFQCEQLLLPVHIILETS